MATHPSASSDLNLNATRRFYLLRICRAELDFHATALVWLCVVAGLWVIGWTIAHFSAQPSTDPEIAAAFMPWARGSIHPEPDERRLYIVLTLLSPLFLLVAWVVVTRWLLPRPDAAMLLEGRGYASRIATSALAVFILGAA